mmetsp:Transcript_3565/g.5173  ORF Transcript_3565/g.5173 Transcript_3565/m.5173 type:complete len:94 (+) Transcript_3565:275-556(+)
MCSKSYAQCDMFYVLSPICKKMKNLYKLPVMTSSSSSSDESSTMAGTSSVTISLLATAPALAATFPPLFRGMIIGRRNSNGPFSYIADDDDKC